MEAYHWNYEMFFLVGIDYYSSLYYIERSLNVEELALIEMPKIKTISFSTGKSYRLQLKISHKKFKESILEIVLNDLYIDSKQLK